MWQHTLWGYCCLSSLFSTGLITVDRYIFITRGIHYRRIVTPRRVAAAVALAWTLPAAVNAAKPAMMILGDRELPPHTAYRSGNFFFGGGGINSLLKKLH